MEISGIAIRNRGESLAHRSFSRLTLLSLDLSV